MGEKLTAAQALVGYGRAWFEPEQAGRVEALRRCCTEDVVFVQGTETYHGLDEVATMIGSFSSSAPAPEAEAAPSEGRERGRTAGTDFCEVADDGRMKLITVWPANDDFPLPDAARGS